MMASASGSALGWKNDDRDVVEVAKGCGNEWLYVSPSKATEAASEGGQGDGLDSTLDDDSAEVHKSIADELNARRQAPGVDSVQETREFGE